MSLLFRPPLSFVGAHIYYLKVWWWVIYLDHPTRSRDLITVEAWRDRRPLWNVQVESVVFVLNDREMVCCTGFIGADARQIMFDRCDLALTSCKTVSDDVRKRVEIKQRMG